MWLKLEYVRQIMCCLYISHVFSVERGGWEGEGKGGGRRERMVRADLAGANARR